MLPLLVTMKISKIVLGIVIVGLLVWLSPSLLFEIKRASLTPEEKRQQDIKSDNLTDCLFTADDKYRDEWNRECKALGLHNECDLDANKMNVLFENLKKDTEECDFMYK